MYIDIDEIQNWSFATYANFMSRMRSNVAPTGKYGSPVTRNITWIDRNQMFVKMMNFLLVDDGNIHLRKQAVSNVFLEIGDVADRCQNYITIHDIEAVGNSDYIKDKNYVQNVSLESLQASWHTELENLQKSVATFEQAVSSKKTTM